MTFQWTAVAAFLYAEIVILLILCVPIISPLRWQKVFTIRIWSKLANYWNKAFLTIIVLLIVLFLDAVREVRKYSSIHSSDKTPHMPTPNAFDHIQMKLFRAQRNLYISGFSLFLWLVLRRTVSLITMLAKEMQVQMTLETEIAGTSEKAKKYLEENENLQKALKEKKTCKNESLSDAENEQMKQKVENLKEELKKMSHALTKKSDEISEVKKQCDYLKKEYDHLTKEHIKMLDQKCEKPKKKAQ
nr:B-cell receptor-associated protein 29 isoform X2 [Anolis sagrei ordinatus]XP_060634368.1 B-cell receptor-associated protein 29 isoform X2 [Anolis sagrei ordinatus]